MRSLGKPGITGRAIVRLGKPAYQVCVRLAKPAYQVCVRLAKSAHQVCVPFGKTWYSRSLVSGVEDTTSNS